MKQINGVFSHENGIVDIPVATVPTNSTELAQKEGANMNMGRFFFDSLTTSFCHEKYDQIVVVDDKDINCCEMYSEQKNDFIPVHVNKVINSLFKEAIEEGKEIISFENIAFGVSDMEYERKTNR